MNLTEAIATLPEKGFLDIDVPAIDFATEIQRLKREKYAIILAHYYQLPEIQDIADFIGDSLGLSRKAAETDADIILFCGVHFMAETAKILNPGKKVILPDLHAGCSLADSCPPDLFQAFIDKHPGHIVISYINCSAAVKALSDIICTSSNAVKIIQSIPADKPIIFAPDKNLGRYLEKVTSRKMVLWDGLCIVHQEFTEEELNELKLRYPGAKVIAHPECGSYMLEFADFIGSTSALLKYVQEDDAGTYIVATETGIIYQMQKACPGKVFVPAPVIKSCMACQQCPYMKMNTLKKVYVSLKYELPEITLPEELMQRARKPIEAMLALS